MAEGEKIRKHAKRAIKSLADQERGWKEKLKDFLLDVFIIIVAVNVTLWFHNWNEKRHDRELEKNFLIGIRNDLNHVKGALESSSHFYQSVVAYYDSVWIQTKERRIDKAFVDANSWNLMTTSYFAYDNSRYESFKSSGYLRLIKNDSLSMSITFLYTVILPWQENSDKMVYEDRRRDYITYIGSKARIDASGTRIVSDLLNNPEVRFQIQWQRGMLDERIRQKQETAQAVEEVINAIDRELEKRFKYKVE